MRLLWPGSVIPNVGSWMHIVAKGWLMYQRTGSPLWLGLVSLMRAVPLLAFPLVAGVGLLVVTKERSAQGT